jgi:polyphenol oxidase
VPMQTPYQNKLEYGHFETWTTPPQIEMLQVKQVHGTQIAQQSALPCEADGLICSWDELKYPVAIKTADCMPILIEGKKGIVFLHAGWRGLANGILMKPELAQISPQRVLIGPCIHRCCFEVSEDFQDNFHKSKLFIHLEDRLFFDLPQEAKRQLVAKFPEIRFEIAPICTACNLNFHSYRRDKTTQRNWNLYIKRTT